MKQIIRAFCAIALLFAGCSKTTETPSQLVAKADELYEKEEKDAAKKLYEKAAKAGNPDAHFALAYQYIVSDREKVTHYTKAAKQGNQTALDELIELMFTRAVNFDDLTIADPVALLAVIDEAVKAFPTLEVSEENYCAIKKAAEAGVFRPSRIREALSS